MIDTFEASSLQEAHYFAEQIEEWYLNNKRELPWRDIKDPYRIWISEIILQQTRVVQGYDRNRIQILTAIAEKKIICST